VHTRVAEKVQSRRLAAIAMHVRLDAFEKVKTVIDDIRDRLHRQQLQFEVCSVLLSCGLLVM
jgi:hypothetical protein